MLCGQERKRSNADRAAETNEWQQQCDEFERARASDEADYDRMMGERRELKLAIDELSVQERDPLGELEACYVKLNRAQADLRAATAKREETEARRAELDRETARLIEERRAILRALQETFGASAAEYEAEVARGEWLQSQITSVRGILDGEHEKKALEAEPKPEPTRAIRVSHAGSNESDEWRDAPIPPRKTVLDHRPGNFRHPGGEFMHMRGRRQVDTPKVRATPRGTSLTHAHASPVAFDSSLTLGSARPRSRCRICSDEAGSSATRSGFTCKGARRSTRWSRGK